MSRRPAPEGYVWLPAAARELRRDVSVLRRFIKDGTVPAHRVGGSWAIAEPVVDLLAQTEWRPGRPAGHVAAARERLRGDLWQAHRDAGQPAEPTKPARTRPTAALAAAQAARGGTGGRRRASDARDAAPGSVPAGAQHTPTRTSADIPRLTAASPLEDVTCAGLLSVRTCRVLQAWGAESLQDLAATTVDELARRPNVGPVAVGETSMALHAVGLRFAPRLWGMPVVRPRARTRTKGQSMPLAMVQLLDGITTGLDRTARDTMQRAVGAALTRLTGATGCGSRLGATGRNSALARWWIGGAYSWWRIHWIVTVIEVGQGARPTAHDTEPSLPPANITRSDQRTFLRAPLRGRL